MNSEKEQKLLETEISQYKTTLEKQISDIDHLERKFQIQSTELESLKVSGLNLISEISTGLQEVSNNEKVIQDLTMI